MNLALRDPTVWVGMLSHGCTICDSNDFAYNDVLWQKLIDEWQLSGDEVNYINLQQGLHCRACGNNLRSMVLARAICAAMNHTGTLGDWIASPGGQRTRLLEINEAGGLTACLRNVPGHRLVTYPETDMHALPFADDSFDLVVHSDTLEHVANPVHALVECRRILRSGGALAFTVPVVVGRMTRSRAGLAPSFHGAPPGTDLVHSEFGADFWTLLPNAGFAAVTIHWALYPAGLALTARK